MELSAATRNENLNRMRTEKLDLLIIGGGITGAGISLDATARGLKTGLVEMQDFAAGTSSRSTKLIHGGLRYLKQFEVEMVADVSREREIIHRNAGHIVRPTRMMLPIFKEPGVSFNSFSSKVALKLYDELAEVKSQDRHAFIPREEAIRKEPALAAMNLVEAGIYLDYLSDDARLTIEILKKAHEQGALLANYVKVESFTHDENGTIDGVRARNQITQEEFSIRASVVMNATGPWAFQTGQLTESEGELRMRPTKGVHLVFNKNRLPINRPIYLDTGLQDQRMIFIIPRKGKTYIGTTDTDYKGDLGRPEVTLEDVAYLLKIMNKRFPSANLTIDDIEASWTGLRPLVGQMDVKNPSQISRSSVLMKSDQGLITIAGGKLTDYRRMAEDSLEMIAEVLKERTGITPPEVDTANIKLSGGEKYDVENLYAQGDSIGLNRQETQGLIDWYGSNAAIVLSQAIPEGTYKGLERADALSLQYALHHEMTLSPLDYFARRTDLLLFDGEHLAEIKGAVIEAMALHFQWTKEKKHYYTIELEAHMGMSQLRHLRNKSNGYDKISKKTR